MTVFGVHTGLQDTTAEELLDLWREIERLGYGWISVWDHFYSAERSDKANCLEAVTMQAALACATSEVRCGSLVYCAAYRHPAVLANALVSIDHLSGGRADLGLGAGWHAGEHEAYGFEFPPIGERISRLEEAARCIRALLHEERTTFEGRWFRLRDARCEPKAVQERLPIWIGGGGERRLLRVVAELADGWNVGFVSPQVFAHKRRVLHRHCEEIGRDPEELRCAVNVGLVWSDDEYARRYGAMPVSVEGGVLMGSEDEVLERVAAYEAAGADQINLAVRAPWDPGSLERFAGLVNLESRGGRPTVAARLAGG